MLSHLYSTYQYHLFFLFFLSGWVFHAQASSNEYKEILFKLENASTEEEEKIYLNIYLKKAKEEKNLVEIYRGYREYLYYVEGEELNAYIDSTKWAVLQTRDSELIGEAFLSLGIQKYRQKKYADAWDFYSQAEG